MTASHPRLAESILQVDENLPLALYTTDTDVDYDEEDEIDCTYSSFMGSKSHEKSDINYYLVKVSKGYEIMGIIKAIMLSFYVLFVIATVVRKHRLTFY